MPICPISTMYTYASRGNILMVSRLFMMNKGLFHSLWHLRDSVFYLAKIFHIIVVINKLLTRGIMLSSLGGSNWVSIVCIHMKIFVIVSFENYHLPFSHFFWRWHKIYRWPKKLNSHPSLPKHIDVFIIYPTHYIG